MVHGVAQRSATRERQEMVRIAIRATSHVAAWLVWHSMHVSLLDDLEAPAPPHETHARAA
jgi:hypothetical protein